MEYHTAGKAPEIRPPGAAPCRDPGAPGHLQDAEESGQRRKRKETTHMAGIEELNQMIESRLLGRRENGKEKKKKWLLLLLLLLFIALLAGIFIYRKAGPKSRYELDRNALEGFLPGRTEEEIQAELNRIIDEGRVNISVNVQPVVKDGKIDIGLENVPANNYCLQADVFLYPEKGNTKKAEKIYSSGVVKQEHYIAQGDAKTKAAPGEYDGLAVIHALDPDTMEEIGSTGVTLVITVEE